MVKEGYVHRRDEGRVAGRFMSSTMNMSKMIAYHEIIRSMRAAKCSFVAFAFLAAVAIPIRNEAGAAIVTTQKSETPFALDLLLQWDGTETQGTFSVDGLADWTVQLL